MAQYDMPKDELDQEVEKFDVSDATRDAIKKQFEGKESVNVATYDPEAPPQDADIIVVPPGVEVTQDPGGALLVFQGPATGTFQATEAGRTIIANSVEEDGSPVNNTITFTGSGNVTVETGDGFDVVELTDSNREDAGFEVDENGNVIITGSSYTLSGVEVVKFGDAMSVIAEDEDQAIVARMYQILLNREPDLEGLEWWLETLQDASFGDGTYDMWDVTHAFMVSKEYEEKYDGMENDEFLTQLYLGLNGREPDAEGFAYWMDVLANPEEMIEDWAGDGDNAKVHVVYAFAYSDEADQVMGLEGSKYIVPLYDDDDM